jgi:hypothetical protein
MPESIRDFATRMAPAGGVRLAAIFLLLLGRVDLG